MPHFHLGPGPEEDDPPRAWSGDENSQLHLLARPARAPGAVHNPALPPPEPMRAVADLTRRRPNERNRTGAKKRLPTPISAGVEWCLGLRRRRIMVYVHNLAPLLHPETTGMGTFLERAV